MTIRYLEKYESSDGLISYTFPLNGYEYEAGQQLRVPTTDLTGAHYPYDLLNIGPGLKSAASERIRFLDVQASTSALETDLDNMRAKLWRIGRGYLYTMASDGSTRRWAHARLVSMPQITLSVGMTRHVAGALEFRRESDWFATALTTSGPTTINSDPQTVTINNPGTSECFTAITILKGTFTNPTVTNNTTGYSWSSTRDGSNANHWLKVDAGANTVQWSTDGGVIYADDSSLFTRGATCVAFMVLAPGDNSVVFTGCNGSTQTTTFYAPYA